MPVQRGGRCGPAVPEGAGEAAGLAPCSLELGAAQRAERGRGKPGPERQDHAGCPECLGGDRSAAPGDAGREMDVGGVGGVPLEQGPQILDGSAQQLPRTRVVALGPRLGDEVTAGSPSAGSRGGRGPGSPVAAHLKPDGERRSGSQFGLPSQDARRRQGIHGRRVRGDGDGPSVARGPAQSGAVDARGEFGSRPAGRHRAQVREIRAQSDLHGESEEAGGRVAQGDALGSVGASRALDAEPGIGPRVPGDAQDSEEDGPVGGRHPPLEREGFAPRHPQDAAGQEPSARRVHALGSVSGELAVLGADGEGGQGDAEERAVHRGQFARPRRGRGRGAHAGRGSVRGSLRVSCGASGGRDGAEGHGGCGVLSVRSGR